MDEPPPSEKLGIPRGGADGKGAPRGPGLSLPSRGGRGRGALAFLGLRRRARRLSTTNGKAGGQPDAAAVSR